MIRALLSKIRDCRPRIPLTVRPGRNRGVERELEHLRDTAQRTLEQLEWESAVGAALAELYKPLISPDSTIEEMAGTVLDQSLRLTGSAQGYVSAVDPATGKNIVHATTRTQLGKTHSQVARGGIAIAKGYDGAYAGLRGYSLNTGKAFLTNSPASHPAFLGYPVEHIEIERFLSVPVMLDGKAAGQISLANPPRDYTKRDLEAIQRLAGFYALALQSKESRKQTDAALREKEVLLGEIHHRVKNNLQVISSLLNLQARRLRDPEALEMLKESQNRVRSMAMVHEQLHRSRDISRIHFGEYARNLTASLFCSYGIDSSVIALRLHVAEAFLSVDAAVPCGLIIQELVSNALKHAFPDGRAGEISIGLASLPEGAWRLSVADNGIGLSPQVDIHDGASLGLRLVKILADQLEAEVACVSQGGTRIAITFRDNSNENGYQKDNEQTQNSGGRRRASCCR